MPGAGSLKATQYVYGVAPKDGLTLATVSRGMLAEPLLNGTNFDPNKFTWLGSITSETSLCATWKTSAVKTWDDMFKREFSLGGNALGDDTDLVRADHAQHLRRQAEARHRLSGRQRRQPGDGARRGRRPLRLVVVEPEEPEALAAATSTCWCSSTWTKNPDLPDVPMALERAANDEQRQVLRLLIAGQYVGRPFFSSPDVPADRKAALRAAFDATMKDPQFLAEAAKIDMEITPLSAGTIETFLTELYRTPSDVVRKAAAAIQK